MSRGYTEEELSHAVLSAHCSPRITGCWDAGENMIWEGDIVRIQTSDDSFLYVVDWRPPEFRLLLWTYEGILETPHPQGVELLRTKRLRIMVKSSRTLPLFDGLKERVIY